MARLRAHKGLVFLAVGLVLFAAVMPAAAASLPGAILTPLWLVQSTAAVALICREASLCDEQPASLLSLIASRAPPSTFAFA
jgi:hypothetical protein